MTQPSPDDRFDSTARWMRNELVDSLIRQRVVRSARLEEALRTVPRHRFVPEVDLEQAYRDDVVLTKTDTEGRPTSSVSQPTIVALQLEQALPRPGTKVLEIGAGRCYNAALLAHLVGEQGHVVTIDIDAEMVSIGAHTLAQLGYDNVTVKCADGAHGDTSAAPFSLISVTTGAADIPPAWFEQLAIGGRMVVPLTIRSLTRSIGFVREEDRLVSESIEPCGFISMQGSTAAADELFELTEGITLEVGEDQPIDPAALQASVTAAGTQRWSRITIGHEAGTLSELDLWMAMACRQYGRVYIAPFAAARDPHGWVAPSGASATWNAHSLAYVIMRESANRDRVELGVQAFGPERDTLAEHMIDHIRAWNENARKTQRPRIYAYPAETPTDDLVTGRIVDKPLSRLVITFD
ncbi:methyltransferase, FxLD system [Natronoglycomyces albus]|uniref:Protein-L-isoaspartate O-methyltransferase n=1 Tax=Natronoglycomyces albus TaxID=2811108 RepID=A0A895XPW9_9ACTN|nr:methyltransferase, FxLD system [Natronoglycomyces albus]QSB05155.1 methyltransferase, FxLD system [Natronoglycomyces albus]